MNYSELIVKNKLSEFFEKIKNDTNQNHNINDILMLESRYSGNERAYKIGLIPLDHYNLELTRIRHSCFDFINPANKNVILNSFINANGDVIVGDNNNKNMKKISDYNVVYDFYDNIYYPCYRLIENRIDEGFNIDKKIYFDLISNLNTLKSEADCIKFNVSDISEEDFLGVCKKMFLHINKTLKNNFFEDSDYLLASLEDMKKTIHRKDVLTVYNKYKDILILENPIYLNDSEIVEWINNIKSIIIDLKS